MYNNMSFHVSQARHRLIEGYSAEHDEQNLMVNIIFLLIVTLSQPIMSRFACHNFISYDTVDFKPKILNRLQAV